MMKTRSNFCVTACAMLVVTLTLDVGIQSVWADDATITAIDVFPEEFTLHGARARQQLVVTATLSNGEQRDVTNDVAWEIENPALVTLDGSVAHPAADGVTILHARIGELTSSATTTVTGAATALPVSFYTEALAALTKAGCNMGACHGSPSGKGGFRLSLRGYDPPLDVLTLRTEFYGRRTNILDPDSSLLLRKPLMEIAHGGGRRLFDGDASHVALREWIAEGMQLDPEGAPTLERIEVFPRQRVLHNSADLQQLTVQGYFSDGTVRDVTELTVFSSSSETVATVSTMGLVEQAGRGETAILARYLDKMDTSYFTFIEDIEGFAWNHPPEYNFIDRLVNEKLEQLQILPSDVCSDAEFLRRAFLDLTGRLPTLAETEEFLNDPAESKRSNLIDRLLDSPDYASFWTLKWADVLRANSGKLTSLGVAKFHSWLYDGVLNDQPMDVFATELLTASGSVFENPAAAYWRASREPTDATETTAQLFLGIRIQCAKCHNHPFERWSQDNYYGIAAAFAQIGRKPGPTPEDEIIFVQDGGEVTQPRTGRTMPVHLLLEGDVEVPSGVDRREVFAEWLTAPDNPFFARALANRIWGHLLGRGIVDPVDDFRDSNPPTNAALLDELAQQFVEHGYSRRWLIREIMNSHTYQRSARTNEFNVEDELYFSHARTRMLSAEQLLDAICTVTDVPESFAGVPMGTRATELFEPPTDNYFLKVFGQPQREMACECERSDESNLSQALQMINGPVVHNKLRDDNGRIAQMIAAGSSDQEIIATLYRAGLCRDPSAEELRISMEHITGSMDRRLGLEDVGWAILNSKEFLFQH